MMEVFALYGRYNTQDFGITEWDGNLIAESPVLEVFATFEEAVTQMKEYVRLAYRLFCKYHDDNPAVSETTEEDLFGNYNPENDDELNDWIVSWSYNMDPSLGYAAWEMFIYTILREDMPMPPRLYVRKIEVGRSTAAEEAALML